MSKKKVLVVMPMYITSEDHLYFSKQTSDSIMSSDMFGIEIEMFPICNRCAVGKLHQNMLKAFKGIMRYNQKNSVSSAWNLGLKFIQTQGNYDYILFVNNDILVHPEAVSNLVRFAEDHREFILWSGAEHDKQRTLRAADLDDTVGENPHFSFFMVGKDFVEIMRVKEDVEFEPYPGMFDENIKPAYMEDNDMHQRILRAGYKAGVTTMSKFYHFGSRTINIDEDLYSKNRITHAKNRIYFDKKWGFNPETYNEGQGVSNEDSIRFAYKLPFNGSKEIMKDAIDNQA